MIAEPARVFVCVCVLVWVGICAPKAIGHSSGEERPQHVTYSMWAMGRYFSRRRKRERPVVVVEVE